jgi:hypothetical protein
MEKKRKHTAEPWLLNTCGDRREIISSDGSVMGEMCGDDSDPHCWPITANAERLVACVNACAGINPEAVPDLLAALEAVTQQLADLHAAIADQGLSGQFVDDSINMMSEGQTAIESARAALVKARSGG